MGFKNKCYVTVWNDKKTGKVLQIFDKYATATVSTSKKNPNAKNGYETDFNGSVRFIGRAFEKIRTLALEDKDRLQLLEVETTNYYDKEKQRLFTNYICWDFEPAESKNSAPRQPEVVTSRNSTQTMTEDIDLPF